MSKSGIRVAITICVVIGVLVGVRELAEMWRDKAVRQAVAEAVDKATRDAARKAADEAASAAARKAADEMADQMRREVTKHDAASPTPPASNPIPPVIDRAAFKITLPNNSTIDPEDASVDREHLTTANLPTRGTIVVIVVVDNKNLAGSAFDKAAASPQAKLENAVVRNTDTFSSTKVVRSTAITGVLLGERFVFEIGQYEGRNKACLIILEYPEAKKIETVEMIRNTLATFQMKD